MWDCLGCGLFSVGFGSCSASGSWAQPSTAGSREGSGWLFREVVRDAVCPGPGAERALVLHFPSYRKLGSESAS